MLFQTRFTRLKGAAGASAASTVLVGLTAAISPGSLPVTEGWKLTEPAFTLIEPKDKARQHKITKPWLEKNTRPLGTSPGPPTRKTNPGPPTVRKINPGVPAVQGR